MKYLETVRMWLAAVLMLIVAAAHGQTNVLFIGNSYTSVNNLPQMTADVAASMGLTMTWSSNTPGGCTFSQHCTNQSMTLILQGGWDFVVLQEQSQYPSFPQLQVEAEVFPYATQLVNAVNSANPDAEAMFYMTWGRKNGDADNAQYFPVLGTYEGMDSMLYERYMQMAADNDASVCPVGRVWRYLRENHRNIELYQSDGSHPSMAGTYAAACSFYVMFFGNDPDSIIYTPDGVTPHEAETIRHAVHEVVFSHLEQWKRQMPPIGIPPQADTHSYYRTITITPNPTTDCPIVTLDGMEEPVADKEITLVAYDGRCYSLQDFVHLPTGIYVLLVDHCGKQYTGKVVKQ